ncbi:MAG: hypothetical protein ACHQQQ_05690 [Bacteroidota bacterium]
MATMKGMMNNPARNVTARSLLFGILCILIVISYSCKDTVLRSLWLPNPRHAIVFCLFQLPSQALL